MNALLVVLHQEDALVCRRRIKMPLLFQIPCGGSTLLFLRNGLEVHWDCLRLMACVAVPKKGQRVRP